MDFLSRTLPGIGELFSPLEQTIRAYLLPALLGKCAFSDAERQLISLPSRLGELGITDPCVSSAFQFDASQRVTAWSPGLTPSGTRFTIYNRNIE